MKKIKYILIFLCSLFLSLSIVLFVFPKVSYTSIVRNRKTDSIISVFDNNEVVQKFRVNLLNLQSLSFTLSEKTEYYDGTMELNLFQNEQNIFEGDYLYNELKDNVIILDLNELSVSDEDIFSLEIKCDDCTEQNPVLLDVSNKVNYDESLYLNDTVQSKGMVMTLTGEHNNYCYVIISTILFLVSLFVLCLIFIKPRKEKKLYFGFFLEFIISLISILLFMKNLCNYLYRFELNYFDFFLFLFFLSFLIYLFITIIKSLNLKKQQLYLAIAIPIAICYSIMIIPNFVADEPVHFYRAYSFFNDGIFSTKKDVNVPKKAVEYNMDTISNYRDLEYELFQKTDYHDEVKVYTAASGYAFPLYFFADIGILIGKLFSLPLLFTYYLARICNALGMLLFGYFFIKIIPFGKNIALIYLLNPMYIHQGVSVSADSMVNSICLLFIALTLFLKKDKKIDKKEFVFLCLITILLGFAKYIYIPLMLLLILLVKNVKKSDKKIKLGVIVTSIIAILLCLFPLVSMYVLPAASSESVEVIEGINDVNMLEQMKYILLHPNYAIKTLLCTMYLKFPDYVDMFFGLRLGWLSISVHKIFLWCYIFMFFSSPYIYTDADDKKVLFNKKEKWLCNILSLILFLLTILSMWLCWTSIGSMPVVGVQGRYFLPFMILPMLSLVNSYQKVKVNYYDYKIAILMLFVHFGVFVSFIYYFS